MSDTVENILKEHSLRITKVRTQVLEFFEKKASALSHADIEHEFDHEFDRVTLYRTLNSFLEKGLLHKVPDDSGIARFAICRTACNEHQHFDNHVHFKCEKCEKVECFHDIAIPPVALGDYEIHSANLLLQGVCSDCK